MSRAQIHITVNGRPAFSGWNDHPIPIAIAHLSAEIKRLTDENTRLREQIKYRDLDIRVTTEAPR